VFVEDEILLMIGAYIAGERREEGGWLYMYHSLTTI
jgi:hypothetical protein